jgi:hypothetical protein
MKPAIHAILAILGMSSAFANEIVIRSFSINSSFPNREHILKQELPKHEGKDVRIPYMMCGVLTEKHVLKYADSSWKSQSISQSKITLPNEGFANVKIIKERTIEGITQFESNIRFIGPGLNNSDMTITTYDGDGILIRCDTNDKDDPQLFFLQIKKG